MATSLELWEQEANCYYYRFLLVTYRRPGSVIYRDVHRRTESFKEVPVNKLRLVFPDFLLRAFTRAPARGGTLVFLFRCYAPAKARPMKYRRAVENLMDLE